MEPLRIGAVAVDPPLVLAPMEGVTDRLLRRLVRARGGVGMTCTEFVPAAGAARLDKAIRAALEVDPDEHPVSIQVYGREPAVVADAVRRLRDHGADVVDLNMGCPSRRVCARSGGAALLRDLAVARDVVRAARAAGAGPLTVKMRAGWSRDRVVAPELARICQEEGVDAVTVHWRTREDGYGGTRDLGPIRRAVERVSIPVIANGDVVDVPTALETLRSTGAAGLAIGRGALGNPWVFAQVAAALRGEEPPIPSLAKREAVLLGYLDDLRAEARTGAWALGRLKQLASAYLLQLPDGVLLRSRVLRARTPEEAAERVRRHVARLQGQDQGHRPGQGQEPQDQEAG